MYPLPTILMCSEIGLIVAYLYYTSAVAKLTINTYVNLPSLNVSKVALIPILATMQNRADAVTSKWWVFNKIILHVVIGMLAIIYPMSPLTPVLGLLALLHAMVCLGVNMFYVHYNFVYSKALSVGV